MQKGLPLANPSQAGLLVSGFVLQAFGNWIGLDQTLDIIISGVPTLAPDEVPNLTIVWKKGTALKDAIAQTLSQAYPDYKQSISISDGLVIGSDEVGYYSDPVSLSAYVRAASTALLGGEYQGVDIVLRGDTFVVFDGTAEKKPKEISFRDLIGQPTWIGPSMIQFKTAMRADLQVSDFVRLPPGIQTTTPQSQSNLVKLKTAFQGSFLLKLVRHVGKFRDPDAASWVTIFEGNPTSITDVG